MLNDFLPWQPENVYMLVSGNVHAFLPDSRREGKKSKRPAVDFYSRTNIFGAMEPMLRTARCFTTVCAGFAETARLTVSDWEHLLVG